MGGALSCWLTSEITVGGDNCQMPMGEWWYGPDNCTAAGYDAPYSSFDENMTLAMHTLDRDARKVIVDELQQMIYDSYTENPPFYDLGLYGWTDLEFINWGDWAAHPGRTISSGLLWTWFDLASIDTTNMPRIDVPLEEAYEVVRLDETTFSVTVSDPNGDELNVTWFFGDGTESSETITVNTTTSVDVSCSHVYLDIASFELTVMVSDDTSPPNYTAAIVTVIHEADDSPTVSSPDPIPDAAGYILEPVQWTVSAADNESGGDDGYGLGVWWDWGDGTGSATHLQPTENGTVSTIMENHTWTSTGSFDVSVSIWDGFDAPSDTYHNVTTRYEGFVVRENTPPEAALSATSVNGDALAFIFNASASSDLEDPLETLEVRWDFDGDGDWDTDWSTDKVAYHLYLVPGNYTVRLEVRDTQGLTDTAELEVEVAEAIPEFSSVAVLALAMLLIVVVIARRRRGTPPA
jgi:hypothetical protein